MTHTWNQGASLAPATNEMTTGTPEEFLRRYPGAEELVVLLGAVGDFLDLNSEPHYRAMQAAYAAIKGTPARRSNAR